MLFNGSEMKLSEEFLLRQSLSWYKDSAPERDILSSARQSDSDLTTVQGTK